VKTTVALLVLAAIAALAPYPEWVIERQYSNGIYPVWQRTITPLTNLLPVAVLDVLLVLALALLAGGFVRGARRRGRRAAMARLGVWIARGAAVTYLLFLASWGLNYQRVPLRAKLDFERERISQERAIRLASVAVERLNAGHAAAHATPLREESLAYAFFDAQHALGSARFIEPGRPKRSLLQWYFRWAAINGMTVPGALEIILNPDLLKVEVPATLAHEWAHLAGYADESEANFLAWLTCVRSGDPLAQYSAWLDAYGLAAGALPRPLRATLPRLEEGPRQDLRDIAARYERSSPRVRDAAREVYDAYLRAHRVEDGIRSYGVVLQLMLGTRFEENWTPALR